MIRIQYNGTNYSEIEELVGEHNIQGEIEPCDDILIKFKGDSIRLSVGDWIVQNNGKYIIIPHQFNQVI